MALVLTLVHREMLLVTGVARPALPHPPPAARPPPSEGASGGSASGTEQSGREQSGDEQSGGEQSGGEGSDLEESESEEASERDVYLGRGDFFIGGGARASLQLPTHSDVVRAGGAAARGVAVCWRACSSFVSRVVPPGVE